MVDKKNESPEKAAIEKLLGSRLLTNRKVVGCNEEEIQEIERKFNNRLPSAYKEFLTACGKCAGDFMVGTDILYPAVLGLKKFAQELLTESDSEFALTEDQFVFAMHQGYTFLFFSCRDDDPEIYRYLEYDKKPEKVFDHFSVWLDSTIDDELSFLS